MPCKFWLVIASGGDECNNSPNAEEALSLLSMPLPPVHSTIEKAANQFLDIGVGRDGNGWVIIRSGALGAYVASRVCSGRWIRAYWSESEDKAAIVDVTGTPLLLSICVVPDKLCRCW
jgi:hypothetical protein